ncbi:hypothetical protein TMatcc_009914 [Talaromyces marneffei ATCC 18224]
MRSFHIKQIQALLSVLLRRAHRPLIHVLELTQQAALRHEVRQRHRCTFLRQQVLQRPQSYSFHLAQSPPHPVSYLVQQRTDQHHMAWCLGSQSTSALGAVSDFDA